MPIPRSLSLANQLVILAIATITIPGTMACQGPPLDADTERLGRATGPVTATTDTPPSPRSGTATPDPATVHRGRIVETMSVPSYTYVQLEIPGGERRWAAVPRSEVKVGDEVGVIESLVMTNFASRTLNRTFEKIVFGTLEGQKADAPLPVPPASAPDAGASTPAEPQPGGLLPPGHPSIPGR